MTIALKSKHRLKKRLWQQNDITDQRKWCMLPFSLQYPESRFYTQAVFSYIILDLKGWVRLKLKSPAEHFAQWDKSDSLICAAISLPFLYLPVGRCSQWNSQRNYPDLQGPRCWEERGGVWAKLCVTLTVRDNTSQQRLSKIRRERGEERQEIKTFAQTDAHTLTFLMLCFFSLFTAL